MERQHKLSCFSDGEIEKLLNSIDFIIDTEGENELDNDLAVDAFDAAFPNDEEDEKGIEKAINMFYSMLVCVTSSGSPIRLGNHQYRLHRICLKYKNANAKRLMSMILVMLKKAQPPNQKPRSKIAAFQKDVVAQKVPTHYSYH